MTDKRTDAAPAPPETAAIDASGWTPHAFTKGQAVRYRDQGRLTDQAATVVGLRGHNQFGDPCYLVRLDEAAEAVKVPDRDGVKGFFRPALSAGQEVGAYEGALTAIPCETAAAPWSDLEVETLRALVEAYGLAEVISRAAEVAE